MLPPLLYWNNRSHLDNFIVREDLFLYKVKLDDTSSQEPSKIVNTTTNMVNCVDNEKLLKNIITQFCDQNFKFTLNLKILGSIHVQVDNSEVLTCLLDEKFFKSGQNRSLITTNQNLFNPLSVKAHTDTNTAFNLVTTLNQLQQQHQHQHQQQQHQLKVVNTAQLSNVKMQSLSSSSSTSSSASSYLSGDCKQHKRKRSNGQKSDDGLSSSSVSSRSRREHRQSDDDDDDDEANLTDHNDNDHDNEDNLNNSSSDQTPLKRNKTDEPDEAATAAANALSLISAAAVASKLYNQQSKQSVQHNYHLNPYQAYAASSEAEQPGPSAVAGPSARPVKPKAKFLTNDYEQQLKQQIFQQSIENSAVGCQADQEPKKSEEEHESSLEESQLIKSISNQTLISQVQLNTAGPKPFSCHKCQRTFNSKYNVIRHLKQYHADKRMFKCSICGRDYKWVDSLHKHMKLHKQQQQQQADEQKKQEEEARKSQEMSDSGVVVLEGMEDEEEPQAELENDLNNATEPEIDDDSLIILSPKNTFESFL
ncbi:Msn2p [Brachionus plicatilis]|uniref:Msn2p n=1 Tax=Brachionus plicatilis TaxID=10195 RepID=A0A3M7S3X4_BRAPC|nr:Msn2p [Brachionus plicatilis]